MQIVLHVGVHCTDENRLAKCLTRNRKPFLKRGVSVPPPSNYRVLLREAIHALAKGPPAEDAHEILMDEILEDDHADRVILSNDNFFGVPKMAMSQGQFYPMAEQRLADMRELFPRHEIELFLAIRDPATFIPAIVGASVGDNLPTILAGSDPGELRWSHLIHRLHGVAPNVPITVWCNEDTPMIWAQIIREMAGLETGTKIKGGFDLLREIMTREGMQRFRAYLRTHPVMTERQKYRVIAAFLGKYAIDDAVEEVLDMPGWDEDVVDYLTDIYEEDVRKIERMPGVTMIAP